MAKRPDSVSGRLAHLCLKNFGQWHALPDLGFLLCKKGWGCWGGSVPAGCCPGWSCSEWSPGQAGPAPGGSVSSEGPHILAIHAVLSQLPLMSLANQGWFCFLLASSAFQFLRQLSFLLFRRKSRGGSCWSKWTKKGGKRQEKSPEGKGRRHLGSVSKWEIGVLLKCASWTGSSSLAWDHVLHGNSWSRPRTLQSGTLGVGRACLFLKVFPPFAVRLKLSQHR